MACKLTYSLPPLLQLSEMETLSRLVRPLTWGSLSAQLPVRTLSSGRDRTSAFFILPQLLVTEAKFWETVDKKWSSLFLPSSNSQDEISVLGMALLRILGRWSPLPWPVRWYMHSGWGSSRRVKAAVYLFLFSILMGTQLLKWRCHSETYVPLFLSPAPEPRLRDFTWEEKQRNR